jgi:hypothetical protein
VTASLTRTEPVQISRAAQRPPSLPRRFTRGTLFWLFGLSASVLIGSLWGSAVTGNRDTVTEVVNEVAAEQIAQERIVGWITTGLESVGLFVPADTPVADRLLAMPATEQVLADLTDQVVAAAFAPEGSTPSIDPAAALLPAVPDITGVLIEAEVPADERTVAALISSIEPIPLDGGGELPVASIATRVSAALSLAAALAGVALLGFGGAAVLISSDRRAAMRLLAYRLMLTSLSLAVMLRFGSWVADPGGGASPWRTGLSTLLGSHTQVPLLVAVVAGIGAGALFTWKRRRRSAAETIQGSEGDRT